jgi:glycosyltransferase involved in cell wall biosynthesis
MDKNAVVATQLPNIGVVVIGRNEGERLVKCLESARSKVSRLVYVDSGSTDGSAVTAERLGAHVVALNSNRPFTAARARNEGAKALLALYPEISFIQFVDGDCELQEDWLIIASSFLARHGDVAAVCGRRRELHVSASIYNRLCDLEWDTPLGQTLACGGDSLVRWSAFEQAGGFAEGLIAGEEPELCLRWRAMGWKIWRVHAEMTKHDAALTRFYKWWLRTMRGGYAMAEVATLHWRDPLAIWKKEIISVLFWGFVVPACIAFASLRSPVGLASVLIYPAQISRIAIRRGPTGGDSWIYAMFVTLAKFAEFQGVTTYYWRVLFQRSATLIEYK